MLNFLFLQRHGTYIILTMLLLAPPKASQETDVCVYFKQTIVSRFLWQMLSIPVKCHLIYTNIPDVTHHATHNTHKKNHQPTAMAFSHNYYCDRKLQKK